MAPPYVPKHRANRIAHCEDVIAVDDLRSKAIGSCPIGWPPRLLVLEAREFGKSIVLANEKDGESPHDREVDRFVKRTLRDGALAEERNYHIVSSQDLESSCNPARNGQTGAHDPVGPVHTNADIGNVHRSSPAAARSGLLAHELCKHGRHVGPLRQAMAVSAMIRDHAVSAPENAARTDRDRLLPD
jgi:hypothetical protein